MLNRLPLDILVIVTSLIGGFRIHALWQCGDRSLHRLMEFGGVTHYIEHWEALSTEPILPTILLSHLPHLTFFEIAIRPYWFTVDVKNVNMDILPPTITHLALRSQQIDFDKWFVPTKLRPACSLKERFPHLTYLDCYTGTGEVLSACPETVTFLSFKAESVVSITSFPEYLTELTITSAPCALSTDLPRLLTHLKLKFDVKNVASIRWPEQLKYLYILDMKYSPDFVKNLPGSLEELHVGYSIDSVKAKELALLPRGLRCLSLSGQYWGSHKLTPTSILNLPPELEMLKITSICPTELFEVLPPKLTFLHLLSHTEPMVPGLALLPRQLRHLDMDSSDDLSDQHLSLLPPELTVLKMGLCWRVRQLSLLPRSITHLTLPSIADAEVTHLPPNLTCLSLTNTLAMPSPLSTKSISLLPRTITRLTLKEVRVSEDDHSIISWPPLLTKLDFTGTIGTSLLPNSSVANLPSSLTSLTIPGNHPMDGRVFALLPRRLTKLTVTEPIRLIAESDLAHLPPCLACLELWNQDLSNDAIQYLPTMLVEAYIHSNQMDTAALKTRLKYGKGRVFRDHP